MTKLSEYYPYVGSVCFNAGLSLVCFYLSRCVFFGDESNRSYPGAQHELCTPTFPFQISFASPLSTLSDRTRFKNHFRTDPTYGNFAPAILALLNHYNWKRIVFLTQDVNVFNKVHHCNNINIVLKKGTQVHGQSGFP